jgi:hypothetical protein
MLLQQEGVDADSKNKDGRTPLSFAAEKGNQSVVEMLLQRKDVNVDSKDNDNRTPLSFAAEKGSRSVVGMLLQREDVDADSRDKDGRSQLSFAAEKGNRSVVEMLPRRGGVDAGSQDKDGRTPLSFAVENNHKIIKTILDRIRNAVKSKEKDQTVVGPPLGSMPKNSLDQLCPAGEVFILGAVGALDHANRHAHAINLLLTQYDLHEGDYVIQVGFNQQLFSTEVGHLEEIAILSAVLPKPDVLPDLLEGLGKILSPYSGIFCSSTKTYPTPAFKENGERWDIDSFVLAHTKRGPLFSRTCPSRNIISKQILAIGEVDRQEGRDSDITSSGSNSGSKQGMMDSGGRNLGPSRKGKRKEEPKDGNENDNGTHEGMAGGGGDPGPSPKGKGKGKGKEEAKDGDENNNETRGGDGNGGGDEGPSSNSADDKLPTACFDVTTELRGPELLQSHDVFQLFKITGTISAVKVHIIFTYS